MGIENIEGMRGPEGSKAPLVKKEGPTDDPINKDFSLKELLDRKRGIELMYHNFMGPFSQFNELVKKIKNKEDFKNVVVKIKEHLKKYSTEVLLNNLENEEQKVQAKVDEKDEDYKINPANYMSSWIASLQQLMAKGVNEYTERVFVPLQNQLLRDMEEHYGERISEIEKKESKDALKLESLDRVLSSINYFAVPKGAFFSMQNETYNEDILEIVYKNDSFTVEDKTFSKKIEELENFNKLLKDNFDKKMQKLKEEKKPLWKIWQSKESFENRKKEKIELQRESFEENEGYTAKVDLQEAKDMKKIIENKILNTFIEIKSKFASPDDFKIFLGRIKNYKDFIVQTKSFLEKSITDISLTKDESELLGLYRDIQGFSSTPNSMTTTFE